MSRTEQLHQRLEALRPGFERLFAAKLGAAAQRNLSSYLRTAVLALGVLACNRSQAQETLFFDDFNGPSVNSIWSGPLPTNSYSHVPYTGPPGYGFEVLATNTLLRLTNVLWNERRGWSTATNFSATQFRYELRFNSEVQKWPLSYGYFLEMWVLDATNYDHYDVVTLAGGIFDSSFYKFFAWSSITPDHNVLSFWELPTNTYYRIVVEGSRQQNIRCVWLTDAGEEIVGYTFGHNTRAFGSGFNIGISQSWTSAGPPPGRVDTAIDFVRLTGTDVITAAIDVVDGTTVRIGWGSLVGRRYQVQYCADLPPNTWRDFGEPMQGNGTDASVTDTVTNTTRFYRVITLR